MFRALLAAALLAVPTAAFAGGPSAPPKGPPPRIMTLEVERDGKSFIQHTRSEHRTEQRTVEVVVNGRLEKRTITVTVPIFVRSRVSLDGKDVQVFNGNGKRLAGKDLPKFVKSVPVLVSADGKAVDPFYLRLLREDTLVIVAPALAERATREVIAAPVPVAPPVPVPMKLPPR